MERQSVFWFFDVRTSQFLTVVTLPVKNEYSTGLVIKKKNKPNNRSYCLFQRSLCPFVMWIIWLWENKHNQCQWDRGKEEPFAPLLPTGDLASCPDEVSSSHRSLLETCLPHAFGCYGFPPALTCAVIKLSSEVGPLHYSFRYFISTNLDFKTRIEKCLCNLSDEYSVAIFISESETKKQQGLSENHSSEMSENIKFWEKKQWKAELLTPMWWSTSPVWSVSFWLFK